MAFSLWEYLRERTRDAVLAGMQDALDIAEEGDPPGGQRAAADRLTARRSSRALTHFPEPEDATTAPGGPEDGAVNPGPSRPSRNIGEGLEPTQATPQTPDPFTERLSGAIPPPALPDRRGPSRNGRLDGQALFLSDPPPDSKPEAPERRKRGRPRKDEG